MFLSANGVESARIGDLFMETNFFFFLGGREIDHKNNENIQMEVDGVKCCWMHE